MLANIMSGNSTIEHTLKPSGEYAAQLLILAMMLTPLSRLFTDSVCLKWLIKRRRALGVASFCYAAFHTLLYITDMGSLAYILAEIGAVGIWSGWSGFAILIVLAITSNNMALRKLGAAWKAMHRWVYLAAVLTLIHWLFVHNNFKWALIHFIPLGLLELYRIINSLQARRFNSKTK